MQSKMLIKIVVNVPAKYQRYLILCMSWSPYKYYTFTVKSSITTIESNSTTLTIFTGNMLYIITIVITHNNHHEVVRRFLGKQTPAITTASMI